MPTGAYALIRTLVDGGVDTCFTNPGTSEIHLVAALDSVREMRAVLTLFEGVATGAADGYARMTGSPAATLLHLGPGLGNGLANLHNARRAKVPLINIVGDHATFHVEHDAPLQSDIETLARNVEGWVRTSASPAQLPGDALDAIRAASGPPAQVATLIVPADVSWESAAPLPVTLASPPRHGAPVANIEAAAKLIRGPGQTAILLGGHSLHGPGLLAAANIAAATGTKLLAEFRAARIERGAGLPSVERLGYWPEQATAQLHGVEHLILADASVPVSFFGYPDSASMLIDSDCVVHDLLPPSCDVVMSLEELAVALDANRARPVMQPHSVPQPAQGPLTADRVCQTIAAVLPEGAIVSDEALTSGAAFARHTAGAPRHDWLSVSGGAIGLGLPAAVGAAIACPDRPVIALEADGSSLYTIQSLWTMARESLDVTVVLFNNSAYQTLNIELARHRISVSPRAQALTDLGHPAIDFISIATGLGVPSSRVDSCEELASALQRALLEPGPHLIETVVPVI